MRAQSRSSKGTARALQSHSNVNRVKSPSHDGAGEEAGHYGFRHKAGKSELRISEQLDHELGYIAIGTCILHVYCTDRPNSERRRTGRLCIFHSDYGLSMGCT